jgi:hypothetical protein
VYFYETRSSGFEVDVHCFVFGFVYCLGLCGTYLWDVSDAQRRILGIRFSGNPCRSLSSGLERRHRGGTHQYPLVGLFLDYVIPFGVYGLAPLFKDFRVWKVKIPVGIIIVNLIRAFSHTLVGATLWVESTAGSLAAWSFSATYNLTYMIPTLILGAILVPLIINRLPKKYLKDQG